MSGELMAVGTAVMWGFAVTFFGMAGRRSDPAMVNILRLPLGLLILTGMWMAVSHTPWPTGVPARAHLWLGLSGTLGLTFGDTFLFHSVATIGPRRATVVLAATPVFAAVSAWLMLGERLGPQALAGIGIIVAGIVLATTTRDQGGGEFRDLPPAVLRRGLAGALVCAACSGVGNTFAKTGMTRAGADLDPLAATLVRMSWATAAVVTLLWWNRRTLRNLALVRSRRVVWPMAGGLVLGPSVGMVLGISAIKATDTGVASVLMNTVPLTVLLPAWIFFRDPPTRPAVIGILMALGGASLLFLR